MIKLFHIAISNLLNVEIVLKTRQSQGNIYLNQRRNNLTIPFGGHISHVSCNKSSDSKLNWPHIIKGF